MSFFVLSRVFTVALVVHMFTVNITNIFILCQKLINSMYVPRTFIIIYTELSTHTSR